jgi:hypothetical protein
MGCIIGFVAILLVFSSNLIINQNHLLANSLLNKGSFEQLDRYEKIPIKDKERDVGISSITSNPNLEELKNNLCKSNVFDNLGIPLCNPLENKEETSTNNNNDGNDDTSKKEEKKLLEQQQEQQHQEEEDKANEQNNNNNNNDGNVDKSLGIAGLNLNIENKGAGLNKKIDKLKDKIFGEDNQYLSEQQVGKKVNDKNSKNENNDAENLGISGLDLKFQKIEANLEKKIEKLKDKIENNKDNQRLIDHRQENEAKDDDKKDGDTKEGDGETYVGYRFNGDNDNGNENGKDNGNDDKNFNFAAAGDFGCSTNTQNTVSNMEGKDPELVLALGDLSYHSTADCWFDMMSPLKGKMMITLGFHDIEDGAVKMNQYVKSFELNKPYYSYD